MENVVRNNPSNEYHLKLKCFYFLFNFTVTTKLLVNIIDLLFRGRRLPDGGASLRRTVQQDAIQMEKLRGILIQARKELYQSSGGGRITNMQQNSKREK